MIGENYHMDIIYEAWGKCNSQNKTYHPNIYHLIDTMNVIPLLWDSSSLVYQKTLMKNLNITDPDECRKLLQHSAGLHDIGKFTAIFQAGPKQTLLDFYPKLLNKNELSMLKTAWVPHGFLTTKILLPYMSQDLATVIGGHHGIYPSSRDLEDVYLNHSLSDQKWKEYRSSVIQNINTLLPPTNLYIDPINYAGLGVLCGMISMSDWIASTTKYFPFTPQIMDLKKYQTISEQQAKNALEDLKWNKQISKKDIFDFKGLFDYTPNNLQQEIIKMSKDITDEPFLAILEYPMGEGKTEAALYLADIWQQQTGMGCYFAMPTQATANAKFLDFKKYLGKRYDRVNFHLIHGQASMSEMYQQLQNPTDKDNVVADEWFINNRRSILSSHAIGTIDQILYAVLNIRYNSIKLYGLSNKIVIFDEVHSYDIYTLSILKLLIKYLKDIGCSVVLLSATLNHSARTELIESFGGDVLQNNVGYPRVTFINNGKTTIKHVPCDNKKFGIKFITRDQMADSLEQKLVSGGCAAVVCNTVKIAQETYSQLKQIFGDIVYLYHARYPFSDRDKREKHIISLFGKNSKNRPDKAIVVATQVIEQSLDIDFDFMISFIAPIDALMQRMGREHRHYIPNRPIHDAEFYIVLNEDVADYGTTGLIYSPYHLLRTYLTLKDIKQINIPNDVDIFIEKVYEEHDFGCFIDEMKEYENGMQRRKNKLCNAVNRILLFDSRYDDILSIMIDELARDENAVDENTFKPFASTRYSEVPSVSLICLEDGNLHLDGQVIPVDWNRKPNYATVKNLLQRSVNINDYSRNIYKTCLIKDKYPEWTDSSFAYYCVADFQNEEFEIGDKVIRLDKELGIVM